MVYTSSWWFMYGHSAVCLSWEWQDHVVIERNVTKWVLYIVHFIETWQWALNRCFQIYSMLYQMHMKLWEEHKTWLMKEVYFTSFSTGIILIKNIIFNC